MGDTDRQFAETALLMGRRHYRRGNVDWAAAWCHDAAKFARKAGDGLLAAFAEKCVEVAANG